MWEKTPEGLKREYKFRDFAEALNFVNKVGELAEEANHHPDIEFGWGYVRLTLISHDKGEITERDHQLAAKIEKLLDEVE